MSEYHWLDVSEGEEYTPEQATQRFLDLEWEQQVRLMERFQDAMRSETACSMLNHEGAMIFSQNHSCPNDRYEEGWRDGLAELQRRLGESE